jgi:hypothetical protein
MYPERRSAQFSGNSLPPGEDFVGGGSCGYGIASPDETSTPLFLTSQTIQNITRSGVFYPNPDPFILRGGFF